MKHKLCEWVLAMCNFNVKGNSWPTSCFKAVGVFFKKSANDKIFFTHSLQNLTAVRMNIFFFFFAKVILPIEH